MMKTECEVFDVMVDGPLEFEQSLISTLYIAVDGEAFPNENWSDYVVIVLSWWTEQALRLRSLAEGEGELLFMDGPYYVAIRKSGMLWHLNLCRRLPERKSVGVREAVVEEVSAIRALAAAAHQIVRICREQSWETPDLLKLESEVASLEGS